MEVAKSYCWECPTPLELPLNLSHLSLQLLCTYAKNSETLRFSINLALGSRSLPVAQTSKLLLLCDITPFGCRGSLELLTLIQAATHHIKDAVAIKRRARSPLSSRVMSLAESFTDESYASRGRPMALLLLANLSRAMLLKNPIRSSKDCGVAVCHAVCATGESEVRTSLDGNVLHTLPTAGDFLGFCLHPLQTANDAIGALAAKL